MAKGIKNNKTYVLGMFPYPSGEGLHVGHVRIFTACDVMARYFRMKEGKETVLSPMGWDAFGLPAENAAIKAKKIPQTMVPHNYANFKAQMQNLSLSFDWQHELATTDPTYYALTQWIFLKLYSMKDEQGRRLVYREKVPINWCPKCKTGIANEEVLSDGTHERCGTVTGKKLLPQWVMRITSYAERLLHDLDHAECPPMTNKQMCTNGKHKTLDWPKGILEMQKNWIGKKEGVVIHHKVRDMDLQLDTFSAYPAWLFADTFIVLAPEHPLVMDLVRGTKYEDGAAKFVKECGEITDQQRLEDKFEKLGYFTGRYVMDPFNPGREMPVWIANFAMMGFGTGIIRCSSHDVRDYAFAQKYNIETKSAEVVERINPDEPINAHDNEGILVKSGPFTGRAISAGLIDELKDWIVKEGIGRKEVTWHLRDWVFSRQRYWGEPIPLVYCDKCGDENGVVPLTEDQLPLTLPELDSYEPTDTGESPLSRVASWVTTTCPKCGGSARRETDTMPNWAGSCWYYLAYPWWSSVETEGKLKEYKAKSKTPITDFWKEVAKPSIDQWLPADWYLGGAEHAVLHLLYARFWVKVLEELKLLDFPEPFLRLRSVGMVLAEDGKKMSKSLGNVVNPDDMVRTYGSDATRMYEMFMGPWEQSIAWDSGAISGQVRFLERVKATIKNEVKVGENTSPVLAAKLKALVERVEDGVLNQKFNTAIAGLMEFVNAWREEGNTLSREHLEMFASLLSLFAPLTAKEIVQLCHPPAQAATEGHGGDTVTLHEAAWPDVSAISGVEELKLKIAVQVNGKVRAIMEVNGESAKDKDAVVEMALADERVKKWLSGEIKKTIFVPGKLLSLVV